MEKRLIKGDKKICGVCSGFANYLGIDQTIVRIITILLTMCCPAIIIAYFVGALVMPDNFEN